MRTGWGWGRDIAPDGRRWWVVDSDARSPDERVSGAVLAALRPRAAIATIDAYSDLPVPPTAAAAEQALRALKPARRGREAGIGVELNLTLAGHCDLLRAYAAWSINADLFDERWHPVGTFTDTSATILVRLHDDEGAAVAAVLRDLVPFVPLTVVDERRRRQRAEAKAQRRAQRATGRAASSRRSP